MLQIILFYPRNKALCKASFYVLFLFQIVVLLDQKKFKSLRKDSNNSKSVPKIDEFYYVNIVIMFFVYYYFFKKIFPKAVL